MNHKLKIEDKYLQAKIDGDKLFEVRVNDRSYQKGDTVTYQGNWWQYTYEITYVNSYLQKDNIVVFGEKFLERKEVK